MVMKDLNKSKDVNIAANQVVVLTSKPQKLNKTDVVMVTNILNDIMDNPEDLDGPASEYAVKAFCQTLEVDPSIINELQQNLTRLTQKVENMTLTKSLNQVCRLMAVKSAESASSGLGLVSYQNTDKYIGTSLLTDDAKDPISDSNVDTYIYISNSLPNSTASYGFVIYKDSALFPIPRNKDSIMLKTHVISGSVRTSTRNAKHQVTIKLKKLALNEGFYFDKSECVYWDFKHEKWSTNGCIETNTNKSYFTCNCDHLTNFAVIMSVKTVTLQSLDMISYIGCALSILGLLATIIAPIRMRDYRQSVTGKLQINLSIALLGVYIVFLSSSIDSSWAEAEAEAPMSEVKKNDVKHQSNLCTAATWFLHFFLLASFAWMCVQGIALYTSYKRLIQQMENSYFIKVATGVAWGVPALIAIITIAATYPKHYRQDKICWLHVPSPSSSFFSGENVLFWAFLLPISLILLLNMVVFGLIMSKMVCNPKSLKAYRGAFKKTLRKNFAVIFANTVMLGMCWLIGYFMLIDATRGVSIFVLCIMNVKDFKSRMMRPLKLQQDVHRARYTITRFHYRLSFYLSALLQRTSVTTLPSTWHSDGQWSPICSSITANDQDLDCITGAEAEVRSIVAFSMKVDIYVKGKNLQACVKCLEIGRHWADLT
ncbi:adhesion G-protein coupled receptor G7-like [Rhinoraja longicauda]